MQASLLSGFLGSRPIRAAVRAAVPLVCLLAVAAPAQAEGSGEHAQPRTISVSGTGRVTASPDMAIVRLGVETQSGDVGKAIEEAAARSKAITTALEGDGVAVKDIATVDYNVGFVQTPEGRSVGGAGRSGGPTGSGAGSGQMGYYRVSDVAAVTVRDLSGLGKILDGALSAGANEVQGVSFRIADSTPLEREARAMAFRDAHAKAEQIAGLAGEKLGPVLRVSVGGSPVPQAGGTFRAAAMAAPAISPGSLEVSVTLQAVFEIAGRK